MLVGFVSFLYGAFLYIKHRLEQRTVWLGRMSFGNVTLGKSHGLSCMKIAPTWLSARRLLLVCSGCHNKVPQTSHFCHSSGGLKSDVAGLFSSEASRVGLGWLPSCPLMVLPLCAGTADVSTPLFIRTPVTLDWGPH